MSTRLLAWGILAVFCSVRSAAAPNIIVILADDLGFSDVGCYGSEIATPNLDRLAEGGLRFSQFYNAGRCCPTRASLLTGRYSHRAGVGHMTGDLGRPAYRGILNPDTPTVAEGLRRGGYRTLHAGKWHVGSAPEGWPLRRGFDRSYGPVNGGGVYFKDSLRHRPGLVFQRDGVVIEPADDLFVTRTFTDEALDFVEESVRDGRPFFLYLAHIAPHWPLQAPEEDVRRYLGWYEAGWDRLRAERFRLQRRWSWVDEAWGLSGRDPGAEAWNSVTAEKRADLARRMAVYAAQVDAIDRNVGRLVAAVRRLGVFEDTVIFFLSDNGCSAEGGPGGFRRGEAGAEIGTAASFASGGLEWANLSNTPFRRFKSEVHEGGIATPLIAHWPRGIRDGGRWVHAPGHVIDLLPTCLDLAGVDVPEGIDGVSLVPVLRGESPAVERTLFWEHEGNRAVRRGSWKLVARRGDPWELYHLASDRTETQDLAAEHPARVRQLEGDWMAWANRAGVLPWPVRKGGSP